MHIKRESNIELIDNIKKLHKEGLTNRKIAKFLGIHHRTVSDYLKLLKIETNGTIGHHVDILYEKSARCSICKEVRPLDEFIKASYNFSFCRSCRGKKLANNINKNIESFMRDKYMRLKIECKTKNIIIDIDCNYLISLYEEQKGLCFYTDEKLIFKKGVGLNRHALSVDRLIPKLGYVKNNIVLCSVRINTIKSDLTFIEIKKYMPLWYKRIMKYIENHQI